MATTSRPISEFVVGLRTTAGAAVASGKVRFYQPGTLVSQTVYSDAACATPYAQPITLNAGGQANIYTLEAVRCIAKESTDTTTLYDGVINLNRHDAIYLTHPNFNNGAEETLEELLTDLAATVGDDFEFTESPTAEGLSYTEYLGEFCVSVKSYGAVGDDNNDDTAEIQAAIDRVEARGGGWVFFPKGTYKISSSITTDTVGVKFFGAGRGVSIIKNYSTTGNGITVALGSAVDCKCIIKDLSITANTTSSGGGISVSVGEKPVIHDVSVELHRTGINVAPTGAHVSNVFIDSTDDNAACVGLTLGARARVNDVEIVCGTVNGTGLTLSDDSRATGVYVAKFSTGVLMSGARAQLRGAHCAGGQVTAINATGASCMVDHCYATVPTTGVSLAGTYSTVSRSRIVGATTGISLAARNTHADYCTLAACTTGVSVGAHAFCSVVGCDGDTNTLDLSVNASATLFREDSSFSTYTSTGATPFASPTRFRRVSTTSGSATPAWQPLADPTVMNVILCTVAATVAVAAPVTTNAQPGDLLHLAWFGTTSDAVSLAWDSNWLKTLSGGNAITATAIADSHGYIQAIWTGTEFQILVKSVFSGHMQTA
jgi:hypothetical protein